jgi:hypothetical protein
MKTETRGEVLAMTCAFIMQQLTGAPMHALVRKKAEKVLEELSSASALSGSGFLSWEMTQAQVGEIAFCCIEAIGEALELHSGDVDEALLAMHAPPGATER